MNPDFFPAVAFACVLSLWLRRYARRKGITDRFWFWMAMFSGAALLGILLILPKYNVREAVNELRYEGRQRAIPSKSPEINGGGGPPPPTAMADVAEKNDAQPPIPYEGVSDRSSHLIVPPYYLAGAVLIVFVFASFRLQRDLSLRAKDSHPATAA